MTLVTISLQSLACKLIVSSSYPSPPRQTTPLISKSCATSQCRTPSKTPPSASRNINNSLSVFFLMARQIQTTQKFWQCLQFFASDLKYIVSHWYRSFSVKTISLQLGNIQIMSKTFVWKDRQQYPEFLTLILQL